MELMYDVIKMNNDTYGVLEVDTNLLIAKGLSLWEAEKFVNNQKNGGGFQGRTPTFMSAGDNNE